MVDPNSAAFPTFETNEWGLTKHEYFAAMALQGLLSNPEIATRFEDLSDKNLRNLADYAIAAAYFLTEQLNKSAE